MSLKFVGFVLIGKLLIYLLQQFPPTKKFKIKFFADLFECDLCLGVWIYFILSAFLHFEIISAVFVYVPVISEAITAAVTSFIVHLVTMGWRAKFEIFEIK